MSELRFPSHSGFDRQALLVLALVLGLVVTTGTLGMLQRPSLAAPTERGVSAPEARLPEPSDAGAAVAGDVRDRLFFRTEADAPHDSGGASLVLPDWFLDLLAPQASGVWPDCGWNCTAEDVNVTDAWLGDAGGTELPPCTPGEVVTTYIWAEFDNGTSTDRYAVRVVDGVYVNGTQVYTIDDCVTDTIGPGVADSVVYSFTWTCGDQIEIRDLIIPWKTSSGSTCGSTEPPTCNDYPAGQCSGPTPLAVRGPLVANFDATDECFCTDTAFTDTTTGGTPFTDTEPYSYTYGWDFGDGHASDGPTPTHHYGAQGTYTVTLVVTDALGTSDAHSRTVTVYENPVASFEAEPTCCCTPLTVAFTDTSTATSGASVEAWRWEFGDGGTSSQQDPSHAYAAGAYTVTLTVTDSNGCSATVTETYVAWFINVVKDAMPSDGTDFDFTTNFTTPFFEGSFTLDDAVPDDSDGATDAEMVGTFVMADLLDPDFTYRITETLVDGWMLEGIACAAEGASTFSDTVAVGGSSVDIILAEGDEVTCTFTNTAQPGSIVVEKVVEGQVPEGAWGFAGDLGAFSIAAGGGISTFGLLEAGAYAITETVKDGYDVAVVCDSGERGSQSVSVDLGRGESVTCVFTNTAQPGSIVVEKVVDGQAPEGAWGFTGDLGAFSIAARGGISTFAGLEAGTYTITETVKDGYDVAVACDSGESGSESVTVDLGPGQDVTCVFTNTAQPEVAVDKRLTGFDRGAYYIKALTFTIVVANVGPNPIDVLPLEDVYDAYYLSFADATPYPEEDADDGTVAWHDLTGGAPHGFSVDLAPGDAFSVTAVFTVAHEIVTTVNTAVVSGAVDAYDNIVPYAEDDLVVRDTPTAVELLYFRVDGVEGREVALGWATAVELDTLGFGLYRAAERDRSRAQLVASVPSRGQGIGAAYTHNDAVPADGVWWYWLGKIGSGGDETVYGPVASAVGVSAGPARAYLPVVLRR